MAQSPIRRSSRRSSTGEKRDVIRVQVTPEEKIVIQQRARANNVSMSRYLLDTTLRSTDSISIDEFRVMVETLNSLRAELNKVGSNLNQIARHANTFQEVPSDAGHVSTQVWKLALNINRAILNLGRIK